MSEVEKLFSQNITSSQQERKIEKLQIKHSDYLNTNKPFLSLDDYLNNRPEKYYSEDVFHLYYNFLLQEQSNNEFLDLLNEKNNELNIALHSMKIINNDNWHESIESIDDYNEMLSFDLKLCPAYLKIIEGVYFPFIHLIAFQSRIARNKSTEKLDIFNCVEEIKNSKYDVLTVPYNHTIRNGIAHGGLRYTKDSIFFIDKKSSQDLSYRAFLRKLDDLVDCCNAMIFALKIFFNSNIKSSLKMPLQIMIEELKAKVETPFWKIQGVLESNTINNESQLMIFGRPESTDINKIRFASIMTGVLAEYYSPGYKRYFISLISPICQPGWVIFDGDFIREKRLLKVNTFDGYKGLMIEDLLYFVPNYTLPKLFYRIGTYILSAQIIIPLALEKIRENMGRLNLLTRDTTIHRNGYQLVLNGAIVIENNDKIDIDKVKNEAKRIIKMCLKAAKRKNKNKFINILPLGYARIAIFQKDYRERRLKSFGLGSDLIGTVQIKRIKRINSPDIFNSEIEIVNGIRFAWNKNWIALQDATTVE